MDVRPDTPEGLKPKDLIGIPWRLAFALRDDGWYLRSDIVWNKTKRDAESVRIARPARMSSCSCLPSRKSITTTGRPSGSQRTVAGCAIAAPSGM